MEVERMDFVPEKGFAEGMDFVPEKGFAEGMDFVPEKGFGKGMDFVPEKGFYQPSNDDTWESYQALLCVVEEQLGGFPRTVVCGVADEVLGIFRNRYLSQIQKQYEVEKLIGTMSIDVFNQLVLSTNEIKDYNRAKHEEILSKQGGGGEEEEGYFYQPRSSETWRAYNSLLNTVVDKCGVQPHLVLCFAANELIAVLKNEDIQEDELKKVIGDILDLGFVTDELFRDLVAIVELITDYNPEEFVGPTDLIREDTLMMMMGEERKEVKRKRDADEEPQGMWLWSDDEGENDPIMEGRELGPLEDDLMVKKENVGPVEKDDQLVFKIKVMNIRDRITSKKAKDDLMVKNENEGPVEEYHQLAKDVKEKLVLNEEVKKVEDEDEDEDGYGWVVGDVTAGIKEKLVLNEVEKDVTASIKEKLVPYEIEKDEDEEDDWVVV